MTGVAGRWLPVATAVVAFWPVWPWLVGRLVASPEARLGLLAAAAALWPAAGRRSPEAALWARHLPVGLLALYAAAFPMLPGLARAALGLLTVWLLAAHRGSVSLPRAGLILCSLPVLPTVDFLIGYPLRRAVAELAAVLLRGAGFAVQAAGTVLTEGGRLVAVDPPCSGVRMLWTATVLALALARFKGLRTALAALLTAGAAIVAVLGNGWRAAALFLLESGALPPSPWLHSGVGLVTFAAIAAGLVALASLFERASCAAPSSSRA